MSCPNSEGSSFKSQLVGKPPSDPPTPPPPPPQTATTRRRPTTGHNFRTLDNSSQLARGNAANGNKREPAQVAAAAAAGHKGLRVAVANLQKLDYVTELVDELVESPSLMKPVGGVRTATMSLQHCWKERSNKATQQGGSSKRAAQCNCSCQSAPEINQVVVADGGGEQCTWCSDKKSHSIGGTEQSREGIEQSAQVCCTCCCGCPVPNDELQFAWPDRAEANSS